MTTNSILLIDSHNGIYVPHVFLNNWSKFVIDRDKMVPYLEDLQDVGGEYYWDSWEYILDNAKLKMQNKEYVLRQNEDVWAIPVEEEAMLADSEYEGLANYMNED
jgi:hypothetical protein